MRDDRERLLDISEAIARIEKYAVRGKAALAEDELLQTWVLHHLQIIGEAARALSPTFRAQTPTIAWAQIIGMRNILVHNYFGIDLDIVWAAVERDLPLLKAQIAALLEES